MHRITMTVLAGTGLIAACTDSPATPLAPVTVAEGRRPFAPGSVIPGAIAFTSRRTGRLEIFAMNPGGQNVTRLTFSEDDEIRENQQIEWSQQPAWSPDGRTLAFTRRARDLATGALIHDVHVLDLDDPDPRPRRLMDNPGLSGAPAWSPDGRRIAYCSFNAGPAEIWTFDLESLEYTRMGTGPACWPHWSPDGTKIAYHTTGPDPEIMTIDVATREIHRLTTEPGQDVFPEWSPDGSRIAFRSARARDEQGTPYWAVFVMDADGGNVRNLTPIPAGVLANQYASSLPAWSNDGQRIYFESWRPATGEQYEVFVTDLAGTHARPLTGHPAYDGLPSVRPVTRP